MTSLHVTNNPPTYIVNHHFSLGLSSSPHLLLWDSSSSFFFVFVSFCTGYKMESINCSDQVARLVLPPSQLQFLSLALSLYFFLHKPAVIRPPILLPQSSFFAAHKNRNHRKEMIEERIDRLTCRSHWDRYLIELIKQFQWRNCHMQRKTPNESSWIIKSERQPWVD